MKKFRFIEEDSTKLVFEAHGLGERELFMHAAEALFSVTCRIGDIEPVVERTVEADADNLSDLLINWLQALLVASDMEDIYFSKFEILDINGSHLRAICSGEPMSLEKKGVTVKAASYQNYFFDDSKNYRCKVTLEI